MLDVVEVPKRGRPRKPVPEFICKSKADRYSGSQEQALRMLFKDTRRNADGEKPPAEWQAVLHSPVVVQCDINGLTFLDCGHRIKQRGMTPFRWCSECYRGRMRRIFSWR